MIQIDPQTVVLQILLAGAASPLQVAERLQARGFKLAKTAAYVALGLLEKHELVHSDSAPTSERRGPAPRVFSLTDKGRRRANADRARIGELFGF